MEKEKGEKGRCCELKLRVSETFDLEKAVCSHGLFMMPPNYWHSPSKTFLRPLRLSLFHDYANDDADDHHHDHHASTSHLVSICHSQDDAQSLCIRVFGTRCLSSSQQEVLLDQVKRMLRLSADETMKVKGFQDICGEARERNFGRVFRSPTLFEDMVKCILLCNCQLPHSLSLSLLYTIIFGFDGDGYLFAKYRKRDMFRRSRLPYTIKLTRRHNFHPFFITKLSLSNHQNHVICRGTYPVRLYSLFCIWQTHFSTLLLKSI